MKLKHWFITLFIFFICHTVVSANGTLDNLTQDDGISALEAGDALGFEVLSRAELESVRGEAVQYYILSGYLMSYKSLYSCAINGFCAGAVLKSFAQSVLKNPSGNCVYSGTSNSTVMYCN